MFLISKGEVCDFQLPLLIDFIGLLDEKITQLLSQVDQNNDGYNVGIYENTEYFIGIGFVAMQQYMVDTMWNSNIDKKTALKYGSVSSNGKTCISLINSAANWWKHEPEGKLSEYTFQDVFDISKSLEYPLSNVLALLCESNKVELLSVIRHLESWRDEFVTVVMNQKKTTSVY